MPVPRRLGEALARVAASGQRRSEPPPTRSPCRMWRWPRSPTPVVMGRRCWSARHRRLHEGLGLPTCGACARVGWVASSPSDGPSATPSAPPSPEGPPVPGLRPSMPPREPARPTRQPWSSSPGSWPSRPATPPGSASSCAASARIPVHGSTLSRSVAATATPLTPPTPSVGQLAHLDARHRAHAKDTGLGRFPSRGFAINAAWLAVVLLAADLTGWTQTILLADNSDLARAEPKTLRYRLPHVAARLTRGQCRLWLRIQAIWPPGSTRWPPPSRCLPAPQT
jgi:hypothetical protein